MIYCVFIALAIYIAYNIAMFGINNWKAPHSISDTYYLLNEKINNLGLLLPVTLTTMMALLLPAWLTYTAGSTWQFLIFLTCAPLLFVAYAPAFRKKGIVGVVHCVSAMISMICFCIWLYLEMHMLWLIIPMIALMIILGLINKTLVKSYIYWLEAIVFMTLAISVIILVLL